MVNTGPVDEECTCVGNLTECPVHIGTIRVTKDLPEEDRDWLREQLKLADPNLHRPPT